MVQLNFHVCPLNNILGVCICTCMHYSTPTATKIIGTKINDLTLYWIALTIKSPIIIITIYLIHVEFGNFRQEQDIGPGLVPFYSTLEVAKSLVPSNVKGHGKVLYQKPQPKSMAHGV